MSETGTNAPDWYPDPYGRHEMRFYDGTQWTEHVSSHGKQSVDPPGGAGHIPVGNRPTEKVQRDLAKVGVQAGAIQGGGSIFTASGLPVSSTLFRLDTIAGQPWRPPERMSSLSGRSCDCSSVSFTASPACSIS